MRITPLEKMPAPELVKSDRHTRYGELVSVIPHEHYSRVDGRYTVVPASLPSGGVKGQDKWYGIKEGFVFTYTPEQGFIATGALKLDKAMHSMSPGAVEPTILQPDSIPEELRATFNKAADIVKDTVDDQEPTVTEISDISEDTLADLQALDQLQSSIRSQSTSTDLEIRRQSSVRVVMQGTFGKVRGTYQSVIDQDDLVILVAHTQDQIFTPGVQEDTIKITCNSKSFTVHYTGIEFEVPSQACIFQVFVKAEG